MSTGASSATTRTGVPCCAYSGAFTPSSSTGVQALSSNPGLSQPGSSRRASQVSPSSRSAETSGPVSVLFQLASVMI